VSNAHGAGAAAARSGGQRVKLPPARRDLRQRGIRVTIPRRKDRPGGRCFDRTLCRARNVIERLTGRLKQSRRIATRCDKRAESYRIMRVPGAIHLFGSPNTP
jgi:transposase